jgi:hypothetical protein
MHIGSLSWPEDPGYDLHKPGDTPTDELEIAMAALALAGAKRNRYGALPGRDPAICATLNDDVTTAQARCDAAREALQSAPKDTP